MYALKNNNLFKRLLLIRFMARVKIENLVEVECPNLNLHHSNDGSNGKPVVNKTGLKVQLFLNELPLNENGRRYDPTVLHCDLLEDGYCKYSGKHCLYRYLTKLD